MIDENEKLLRDEDEVVMEYFPSWMSEGEATEQVVNLQSSLVGLVRNANQ
jgi:hypothetical protein